jgi:hypothetical protein
MPSKTATDYDRPKAVLFTHSFNGLALEDVIGMGPNRPTLEQVRAVDFVMEMTDSGAYVAHPTSAQGGEVMKRTLFSLLFLSIALGVVEWAMKAQPETSAQSVWLGHLSNGTFVMFMAIWPWSNVWPFGRRRK